MTDTRHWGDIIIAAFILLATISLYLLLDLAAAVSLNPIISGGFALAVLALTLFILDSLAVRRRLLLAGILVSAVFAVRFIDWDGHKSFLRDFNKVQLGMTAEQVDQVMVGYTKNTSPFVSKGIQGEVQTGMVSYERATGNKDDSDIGQITFAGGHVIGRSFSPRRPAPMDQVDAAQYHNRPDDLPERKLLP